MRKLRGSGKLVPLLKVNSHATRPKSTVKLSRPKSKTRKLSKTVKLSKLPKYTIRSQQTSEQQAENTLAIINLYYSILPAMAYIKHTIASMENNVNVDVISSYEQALAALDEFSKKLSAYIDKMDPTRNTFIVPRRKTVEEFRKRLQEYYDIFFITDAEIQEGKRLLLENEHAKAAAIKQLKEDDMMDMLISQLGNIRMANANMNSSAARRDPELNVLVALMEKL